MVAPALARKRHLLPRCPADVIYFASGASAPHDMRGFVRALHPFGVSLPELSEAMVDELCGQRHLPLLVFVDTGAFSEVAPGPGGGLVVAHPITDGAWRARLAVALRIAQAYGNRATIVAPDRVADQAETLARLRLYAPEVHAIRSAGARIVVAIQMGELAPAAFDAACCAALGFDDFVRGIPGNKAAMPSRVLEEYLRAVRPPGVHLLGIGLSNRRLPGLLAMMRRVVPGAALSCDSATRASLTGRCNGAGGGARALTTLQDEILADGVADPGEARTLAISSTLLFAKLLYGGFDILLEQGHAFWPPPQQPGLFDE